MAAPSPDAAANGTLGSAASPGHRPHATERRAARALLAIGVCQAVLLATHRGEFWPFSVYPMFSVSRPWARAVVREVSQRVEESELDAEHTLERLPGAPLALGKHGSPQNDLSSLVQNAERWGPADLAAVRELFGSLPCERPLLILRVHGALGAAGVQQHALPVARLWCDPSGVQIEVAASLRPASPGVER